MNAYFVGPAQDKSGAFHICWVWRNTPDCATNHDLCYALSKDLVRWETSVGRPLSLPITLATAEVVDPVPPGGGMINGNTKVGFDAEGRPVISYHKFDAQGTTQLYNARRETGGWRIYQTSDWDYRWEFQGGGTMRFEIGFGPVVTGPDGSLTQTWQHVKHGSGNWKLDPQTLKPVGKAPRSSRLPKSFSRVESAWSGMEVRTAADQGLSDEPQVRYVLRWETLPSNRDQPRPEPLPPPTMLRLYEVREQ
jgi:BNR repeat-containing family member